VPEGQLPAARRLEDVLAHRAARLRDGVSRLSGGGSGQLLADRAAEDGEEPQHALHLLGQRPHTREERVAEARRNRRRPARRPQLLREERVPVGARVHGLDGAVRHGLPGDRRELRGGLLAREARQLEVGHRGAADELGD
jgi:hypothetical protein